MPNADKLPIKFKPQYRLGKDIISNLLRIESVKGRFESLPITPKLLATLRHSARLLSTHYSTAIEGNRLSEQEVKQVLEGGKIEKGRKRDKLEVMAYYRALDELESMAEKETKLSEEMIKKLHALVMGGGKKRVKPTPYRTEQNVIKDAGTGRIIYLPPEAKDVPKLMEQLLNWLDEAERNNIPCPLRAAAAHYQFATVHPYIDGNGRTARLIATLILRLGGYGLKGIYSLDEYYAQDLQGYYDAISVGPSHNYYLGRAKSDITKWIGYFVRGMAESFEKVKKQAEKETSSATPSKEAELRQLDSRQKNILQLFLTRDFITSKDVVKVLKLKERTARLLCREYVKKNFLKITEESRKKRKYKLADKWEKIF